MKKLISAIAIATFAIGTAYAQMPAKADATAMANGAVDAAKTSATTTAKTAATNAASNVTSAAAAKVDAKAPSIGALPANVPAAAQKTMVNDKPVKVNSHKKHMKKHHKQSAAVTAKKTR